MDSSFIGLSEPDLLTQFGRPQLHDIHPISVADSFTDAFLQPLAQSSLLHSMCIQPVVADINVDDDGHAVER